MGSLDRELLEWPDGHQFYLTLDLECDYGTALENNTYQALERTNRLVRILEQTDVPLTCFVQTEVLAEAPESVEQLRALDNVSFHPHSHTHSRREDIEFERELAVTTERFSDFFGHQPIGYRFPNGNHRQEDYRLLAEFGYQFDAGFFPSWRPRHFDNSDGPLRPHRYPELDVYELPFSVAAGRCRVPTSLSYLRLLGRPFRWLLWNRPPETVVFNIHMHDLWTPPAYDDLPPFYKAIYSRNADGFDILRQVLDRFSELDHSFSRLDDLHRTLRESREDHSRYPISSSRSSTEPSREPASVPSDGSGLR